MYLDLVQMLKTTRHMHRGSVCWRLQGRIVGVCRRLQIGRWAFRGLSAEETVSPHLCGLWHL